MTTNLALVFNKESNQTDMMTAREYEIHIHGNQKLGITPQNPVNPEDLEITHPETGVPLTFRHSHYTHGHYRFVTACWVRPDGHGDENTRAPENFKKAIQNGKSILLSLNMHLASHPIRFANMTGHNAQNLGSWVKQNEGNYITVSIKSIQEATQSLGRIREVAGDNAGSRIFALHRGGVMPFRHFFIGKPNKMANLYNDMQNGKGGIQKGGKSFIGFPRLMPFIPTQTTINENGAKGFKGNHIRAQSGAPYLTQLTFPNGDYAQETDPYRILREQLTETNQPAIYVLATPTITLTQGRPNRWKHMRLSVEDIPAQTMAMDSEAKRLLLRHQGRDNQFGQHPLAPALE
ncbi:MAG: hypothetical protein ACLFP8_03620 [Alphaproteobacteria bacterium]